MINVSLEKDFVQRVGSEIDGFSWKDDKVATCRCPYCGDSKKKKNKKRGYFYVSVPKAGSTPGYMYKCHNCGISVSLYDFLEYKNPRLHNEMKIEFIKMKKSEEFRMPVRKPKVEVTKPRTLPYRPDLMQEYPTIFDLDKNHRARVYMEDIRKVPKSSLMRIYYVEDFPHLANQIDPSKELNGTNPRIVFPLYTREKSLFGVSARCIGSDSDLRYIIIKRPDSKHIKSYGLERFDPDKSGYCVEGALDSEFLPNCIALSGAGKLKKNSLPFNPDNMTMVFDNEPRNKDIVKYMKGCLNNGLRVCIWGREYPYNDVNDGIQNGWTATQITEHIEKNSYKGLQGLAKMATW